MKDYMRDMMKKEEPKDGAIAMIVNGIVFILGVIFAYHLFVWIVRFLNI